MLPENAYIILEGIDGCGKTSQAKLLAGHIKSLGQQVCQVREPEQDLPTGKLIRELLSSKQYPEAHPALFLADRILIQTHRVAPAQKAGSIVISDRSFLSTVVYQQEHWPKAWLLDLHRCLPVKPNLIILIDIPAEEAVNRASARGSTQEYYDSLEIQKRNRQRYLELVTDLTAPKANFLAPGGHVTILSGIGTVEEVRQTIKGLL